MSSKKSRARRKQSKRSRVKTNSGKNSQKAQETLKSQDSSKAQNATKSQKSEVKSRSRSSTTAKQKVISSAHARSNASAKSSITSSKKTDGSSSSILEVLNSRVNFNKDNLAAAIMIAAAVLILGWYLLLRPTPALSVREPIELDYCGARPKFVSQKGLPQSSGFNTLSRQEVGLALTYDKDGKQMQYIDPTYDNFGNFGVIVYDQFGNTYVNSVPFIDLLENKPSKRNTIYKVDTNSGQLAEWASLPLEHQDTDGQQPYGIVGMFYDCQRSEMVVSSLTGTTEQEQKGSLWRINILSGEATKLGEGEDYLGVAIGTGLNSKDRYLLAGSTVNPVVEVSRYADGKLEGEFGSLLTYHPEGLFVDARVKKFRQTEAGTELNLALTPFDYSLRATAENREERLLFKFNDEAQQYAQSGE